MDDLSRKARDAWAYFSALGIISIPTLLCICLLSFIAGGIAYGVGTNDDDDSTVMAGLILFIMGAVAALLTAAFCLFGAILFWIAVPSAFNWS